MPECGGIVGEGRGMCLFFAAGVLITAGEGNRGQKESMGTVLFIMKRCLVS